MRFFLAALLALLLSSTANAQTVQVDINRAKLNWTWIPVPTAGAPSEFRVKCGTTATTVSKITTIPDPNARTANIKDVISGAGNWFCVVSAWNKYGESGDSNQVPFDAGAAPVGSINLTVQAQ